MSRFILYFIIANVIGAFFIWLVARGLPFDAVADYLSKADFQHLAIWSGVFLLVYVCSHAARVMRWYELVRPLDESISSKTVHQVCLVGLTAILLLPLRLGELVRPYLLAKRTNVTASAALGTAVVERVMDGLAMTGLLFLTLATYKGEQVTTFATTTGIISAAVFSGALVMCLIGWWRLNLAITIVNKTAGLVSESLAQKLNGLLSEFINGFKALTSAGALGRFMVATSIYWIANAASMWVLARYGFGMDLSMWDMTTVLALLVIGIMIPGGPGMAGSFEFFMSRALALFIVMDIPENAAKVAAFAALVHILQLIVITVPGFFVMWIDPQSRNLIKLANQAHEQNAELEEDGLDEQKADG